MTVQDKYKVSIELLPVQQISILRAIYREGEKHLKYFYGTMGAFSCPENRVKCFDTKYYEEVMPEVARLLKIHESMIKK